jgi:superfamily II DNA or RNA helicase
MNLEKFLEDLLKLQKIIKYIPKENIDDIDDILNTYPYPTIIKTIIKDDINSVILILKLHKTQQQNIVSKPTNKLKEKYLNYYKIIFDWLSNNNKIVLRENQKKAFELLAKDGIQTGIHNQATGAGKSYILLRYIHYVTKTVIIFTERIDILNDLFSFDNETLLSDKIYDWKEKGICDLTTFNIINRVTIKKKDWVNKIQNARGKTLLVINRAYLTNKTNEKQKDYSDFKRGDIELILHDECHNTPSTQCQDFLKHCKSIDVHIVGFSATPLRTGKGDKSKLLEIYGLPNEPTKLNLLTNYNMMYSIQKKLILPPEFYWYTIEAYNKINDDDNDDDDDEINEKNKKVITKYKNNEVTDKDINSMLKILNDLVNIMPNKKIVAWCGMISMAKLWIEGFKKFHKNYKNLVTFTYGIDTSHDKNDDYNKFKTAKGNAILFCASKHREGSDIQYLDCCIFLDKVKNRGVIPFIQSIGRPLRICPNTPNKTKGIIIDCVLNTSNDVVDKIMNYYKSLLNVSNIGKIEKQKFDSYIKFTNSINFDKKKETIEFECGDMNIIIKYEAFKFENIQQELKETIKQEINLDVNEQLLAEYVCDKLKNMKLKIESFVDYEHKKYKYNLTLDPKGKYTNIWKNWYDYLGVDISNYPKDYTEWKKKCIKLNITNEREYHEICDMHNLPWMVEEMYREHSTFKCLCELDNKKT